MKRARSKFEDSDDEPILEKYDPKKIYSENQFSDPHTQIRLLRLYAGTKSTELEANFVITEPRGVAQSYEALSYTWGAPSQDTFLRLLSHGEAWTVPITPNLHSALQNLRDRSQPRLIWVDALCIDQYNNEEKNAQIPRMASIYRNAADVCIWLGPEADDSELAMKFVRQVLNLDSFDRLIQDPRHQKEWIALSALMRRDWFSRRWVIQEITFAKQATLHCGKNWVKWKEFAHVVGLIGVRHHDIRRLFIEASVLDRKTDHAQNLTSLSASRLVHTARNLFHKSDDGEIIAPILPLETLVYTLVPFQATRLHDTIYAILPLAAGIRYRERLVARDADVEPQHLPSDDASGMTAKQVRLASHFIKRLRQRHEESYYPIDYNKSYLEVCKDFVSFTLRRTKSLDILCRPWAPDSAELPSWIAQLSAASFRPGVNRADSRVGGDPLVGSPSGNQRIYNADRSRIQTCDLRLGDESKVLRVEGFILDYIEAKMLPAQQGNIPAEWTAFASWHDATVLPPDHFWRTLVADRGPDGLIPPSYYQLACQHAFDQRITGGALVVGDLLRAGMPTIVSEFLERVQSVVFQRRLIRSQAHKLYGLAPLAAKKQDVICILYGLSVPVLLRPDHDKGSGSLRYRLIGECYIHGMMNGEALRLRKQSWHSSLMNAVKEPGPGSEFMFEII